MSSKELTDQSIKWDRRMMGLAEHVAQWSKDPSTKVGAVISNGYKKVISVGYNGFPEYISDSPERYEIKDLKYALVVHAELNAILNAAVDLTACTLYTTLSPCRECAKAIIQAKIHDVVYRDYREDPITQLLFKEAYLEMRRIR